MEILYELTPGDVKRALEDYINENADHNHLSRVIISYDFLIENNELSKVTINTKAQ